VRILVIAEDDRNDQFILRPLIQGMFRFLKKPKPHIEVEVFRNGDWEAAKKWGRVRRIIEENPQAEVYLLCVDRDGHEQRRRILDNLEEKAREVLSPTRLFLAEHAWQELEVWVMAGIEWKLKSTWNWKTIRDERDPKEHYFEPLVQARGLLDSAGRGRKTLGEEAGRNYAKVRQNCPEVRKLEERIVRWLRTSSLA